MTQEKRIEEAKKLFDTFEFKLEDINLSAGEGGWANGEFLSPDGEKFDVGGGWILSAESAEHENNCQGYSYSGVGPNPYAGSSGFADEGQFWPYSGYENGELYIDSFIERLGCDPNEENEWETVVEWVQSEAMEAWEKRSLAVRSEEIHFILTKEEGDDIEIGRQVEAFLDAIPEGIEKGEFLNGYEYSGVEEFFGSLMKRAVDDRWEANAIQSILNVGKSFGIEWTVEELLIECEDLSDILSEKDKEEINEWLNRGNSSFVEKIREKQNIESVKY